MMVRKVDITVHSGASLQGWQPEFCGGARKAAAAARDRARHVPFHRHGGIGRHPKIRARTIIATEPYGSPPMDPQLSPQSLDGGTVVAPQRRATHSLFED